MMMRLPILALALAAMSALPAADAHAQQAQMMMPEPIAESAPTAQRAKAVAELILAGDRARLDAYLKEHAAPDFLKSDGYAAALDGAIEATRTGARTIVGYDALGDRGVGVTLGTAAGSEAERAIIVGLETAAPHRVTDLRMARIQRGGE